MSHLNSMNRAATTSSRLTIAPAPVRPVGGLRAIIKVLAFLMRHKDCNHPQLSINQRINGMCDWRDHDQIPQDKSLELYPKIFSIIFVFMG